MRGFYGTEARGAHDDRIILNWNENVRPDDVVWVLGDVGIGNRNVILSRVQQLNGRKHLITGNHDDCWPGHREAHKSQQVWLGEFQSVQQFAKIRLAGEVVLLSHFPYDGDNDNIEAGEERYTQFRLRDEGQWLLHGHTHSSSRISGPQSIHVGVDAWGLRPARDMEVITEMHSLFTQNEITVSTS